MDEQVLVERVVKKLNLEDVRMGEITAEYINFTAVDTLRNERTHYCVAKHRLNGFRNILAKRTFGRWLLVAELR